MYVQLSLLILFLPLLGFMILIFKGKKLSGKADWLATGLLSLALVFSLVLLVLKLTGSPDETLTYVFNWIVFTDAMLVGSLAIEFGIMIDNLTVIMLVVVTLVSTLVHLYSMMYMKGDKHYERYFAYLGLFSFSMLGIILTHNLLLMYIFWELVGISSYLLIGFYYEKKSATNAANKAFIVNRIGDFGMFIGIMILFAGFSTFSFGALFDSIAAGQLPFGSEGWLTASGLLIFCGAVGKSAQFPLHVWLPDAMEGPTPVSALIHAATMVAAGVYLVARMFPMLTEDALLIIAYTGAFTALIAASIAVTQYDIKKVLAYSTISQLGYMIMALGVGAFTAGIMHLITHAAFKAGLFLGAGSIIYAMHNVLHDQHDHKTDAQDIRNMGGLKSKMPVTYWTFVIFTLAISGVPLTSGFLSKDEILAGTMAFSSLNGHWLLPLIGLTVAGLTAFYMFRLLILTFHGKPAKESILNGIKESPKLMTIPLMVLAALSLFFFYSINPFGAPGGWFYSVIERPMSIVPGNLQPAGHELFQDAVKSVHAMVMTLSVLIAAAGILFAFTVYQWKRVSADQLAEKAGVFYKGSVNHWYFDKYYNQLFVDGTLAVARILHWFDVNIIDGIVNGTSVMAKGVARLSKWIDTNGIDGLVNLTAWVSQGSGKQLSKIQTGRVQTYLVYVAFSFIVFILLFNRI
ncbi:MAG: NADH-quinone oxidoreductase subunit L [Balneolaceae bacterium]